MRRLLVPLLILVVLSTSIDLYVFQGIQTLTALVTGGEILNIAYWAISLGLLFILLFVVMRYVPARNVTPVFNNVINTFLTLFVTKLVFALVLLGEDVFRLGWLVMRLALGAGPSLPARSAYMSMGAAGISLIPFIAFLFGITKGKYHYQVHRRTVSFDDLPEEFDGFKIIQLSDIHSGSLDNQQEVQRGINLLMAQQPDLFIFTGDLVNNRASEIRPWIGAFSQIKAPYGQFSVLGNHDYGDYVRWPNPEEKRKNLEQLLAAHKDLGFRLLLDEHVQITRGQAHLNLLGIENWGKGFGERGNLAKAMAGIRPGEFNLLLSHDPSHWDEQVRNNPFKIHLTFSGHTHGMQFGIEAFGIKWSPVKYRYSNWAGLAEENGRYLYVNRGFGFLGFSGRVGIWPEITEITLKKAISYQPTALPAP